MQNIAGRSPSSDAASGEDLVVAGPARPISISARADIRLALALDHVKNSVDEGEVGERLGKFPRCWPLCASISSP